MKSIVESFSYAVMAVYLGNVSSRGFVELQETSKPAFESAIGYVSCVGVMGVACVLGVGAVSKFLKPEV